MTLHAVTSGLVLAERINEIVVLKFNRPDSLNSLTLAMDAEYRALLRAADEDDTVRAVVVTGEGRAFCAGADLAVLEHLVIDPERPHFEREFREPLYLSKPLIAAINGACVGLGLVASLFCDVRFVAEDAKIGTAFAQRGVIAEHGLATLLQTIIGAGHARDLLLSARIITGDEAAAIGLASKAVPRSDVLDTAIAYARTISETCAPSSIATMKEQFRQSETFRSYVMDADASIGLLREAFKAPAYAEGIRSFHEMRRPEFPGYSTST